MVPRYLVVGFFHDGPPSSSPIEDAVYDTTVLEEALVARDVARTVAEKTGCSYAAFHVIVIDDEADDQ